MRLKSFIVLVFLSLLLLTPQASAHDRLLEISPGQAEVIQEGSFEAKLTFNNPLLVVSGGSNARFETRLSEENNWTAHEVLISGRILTARIVLSKPGEYDLRWRVVSSDGHPISGESNFILDIPVPVDESGEGDSSVIAPNPVSADSERSLVGFYIGLAMVVTGVIFAPIGLIIRRRAKKS